MKSRSKRLKQLWQTGFTQSEETMEHENIFELYQNVDGWERVSDEIKMKIDSLIASGMISVDVFEAICPMLRDYQRFGAFDTASREAVWCYIESKMRR